MYNPPIIRPPTTIADCPPIGYHCLKDYEELGPATWRGIYLDLTIPRRPSTKAQELGTAVHALALEGREVFDSRYVVLPVGEWDGEQRKIAQEVVNGNEPLILTTPINRRTKLGREEWALVVEHAGARRIAMQEDMEAIAPLIAAYRAAVGRTIMSEPDYLKALRMGAAVRECPEARRLIEQSIHEEEIQAEVELHLPTGNEKITIRGRLDIAGAGFVSDLKTADDINRVAFDRSIIQFGYHRQLAHYDWLRFLAGDDVQDGACSFIAVESPDSPAHPIRVQVVQLDRATIDDARERNIRTLGEIAGSFISNQWSPVMRPRQFVAPAWA